MAHNKSSLVVYVIIGLAVIGVITQLFTNAAGFLTTVLTMIGFGVVISGLLYFLLFRKKQPSNNDAKKYKQAVKQSKAKYSQQQNTPASASSKESHRFGIKRKSARRKSHLRVIDGNKSKRKNRASF